MPFVVGLTGGIGCGKSTAATIFGELGAAVIDTDEISHRLTAAGGAAVASVRESFGARALRPDGAIDRARMRKLIFCDAAARLRLENILHPLIQAEAAELLEHTVAPYTIVVVPLLIETGACRDLVQRILVIDCDESAQIARVMQRASLEENEVRAIIAVQAGRETRLRLADDVVHNDLDSIALRAQILRFHLRYLELAHVWTASNVETQR